MALLLISMTLECLFEASYSAFSFSVSVILVMPPVKLADSYFSLLDGLSLLRSSGPLSICSLNLQEPLSIWLFCLVPISLIVTSLWYSS